MSGVGELNESLRNALAQVEKYLEIHAESMIQTGNLLVTLGVALAGAIGLLMRDLLPDHPASWVWFPLLASAVVLGISLWLGVTVFNSRSEINQKSVEMWDTSKQLSLKLLAMGEGDEGRTQAAVSVNIDTIGTALGNAAKSLEDEYKKMSGRLTLQAGFLLAAVALAVFAAVPGYWFKPDTRVEMRVQSLPAVSVTGTATVGVEATLPISVTSASQPATGGAKK